MSSKPASLYPIDAVVPHRRSMSLLDRIIEYGEEHIVAEVDVHPNAQFAVEDGVPSWVGIEYMAQAIAAYAGVEQHEKGEPAKVGFLVGARKYQPSTAFFTHGSVLRITVTQAFQADNGLGVFDCVIDGDDKSRVESSLNVFQPDDVDAFLSGESPI
ncbi:ApeP family dehydratase [Aurantivibrio plasticivorans]